MSRRFMSIWFHRLATDRLTLCQPVLQGTAFVLAAQQRGRMVIHAASAAAQQHGIRAGMVVADAKAVFPSLQVIADDPANNAPLLERLAMACLRYTPIVALDAPDGLVLDISGCAHLWGGEQSYLEAAQQQLHKAGYHTAIAIADTIGTAWAVARYGPPATIIAPGAQLEALLPLPAAALRLEPAIVQRLDKLGLYRVQHFIHMSRSALRRRFGASLLDRVDQALGAALEVIEPVHPVPPYQERLPCLEPVRTAPVIERAIGHLLELLCRRLASEHMGLRAAVLKAYRTDGAVQQLQVQTGRASRSPDHLIRLFALRIVTLEPDLGFEVFVLEATIVEEMNAQQDELWQLHNKNTSAIAELLDRIKAKIDTATIARFLPAAHHWPERSLQVTASLQQQADVPWQSVLPRPIHLLARPESIEVTVPRPDYPPIMFRYKGQLHTIRKADGPERIAPEWWLEQNTFRDYYCVEDEAGCRYWVFRSGSYEVEDPVWFMHGFFA
jgi:protein ImuB